MEIMLFQLEISVIYVLIIFEIILYEYLLTDNEMCKKLQHNFIH